MDIESKKKIRVLMAKPGLDGHTVGLVQVSKALRDRGFEVVVGGVRRTPEEIAKMASDEDADVVGLSILSGAHRSLVPRVLEELKKLELDIPVIVGGVISAQNAEFLEKCGVAAIFGPGSSIGEITETIRNIAG